MELRDRNGLTEAEFLAGYDPDKYPKPSLTAYVAIFSHGAGGLRLLLIRRGGHPYLGRLALPGGFANKNEPLEQTAARELEEETGVRGLPLRLVGVFSAPGRDPRGWVVTAAYTALVEEGQLTVTAGDDAADAQWYDVVTGSGGVLLRRGEEELALNGGKLAFDHAEIIAHALELIGPNAG